MQNVGKGFGSSQGPSVDRIYKDVFANVTNVFGQTVAVRYKR
jgi:hypothetical protein